MSQKDTAKALARIQQQIAKSPQNVAYYDLLSRVQLVTRDFSGAKDTSTKALKLNPGDVQAIQYYATAQAAMGDKDGAINTWKQWSDKHPQDANALATIAEIESAKGDTAAAEDYYKRALQQDPTQVVAANNLAYLMITRGENLDAALTLAQTARKGSPNSPDTADTLAWALYQKGRYTSARDLLEDATKQAPQSAEMQYHLGMTYSKLGDKAQATVHLKKAQTLDPNNQAGKDATAALAQLG
jgi:tetratricopeptide (TPR) repeat protein